MKWAGERTYIRKKVEVRATTAVHPFREVPAHTTTVYKVGNDGWEKQSHHLLDLYQQSGLEGVEKYLEENL